MKTMAAQGPAGASTPAAGALPPLRMTPRSFSPAAAAGAPGSSTQSRTRTLAMVRDFAPNQRWRTRYAGRSSWRRLSHGPASRSRKQPAAGLSVFSSEVITALPALFTRVGLRDLLDATFSIAAGGIAFLGSIGGWLRGYPLGR